MALEMENSMYGPEVLHECQENCSVYICIASFSCHSFSSTAWTVQEFKLFNVRIDYVKGVWEK